MKNKKYSSKIATEAENLNKVSPTKSRSFSFPYSILVFLIACLAYANTIFHKYTQDDAIVIYDNMFTKEGIKGWSGIFSKDTFFGFFKTEGKSKLVKGGRYRPFTPAMFALEYELSGGKPYLGHLINILLFGLLCFMIYLLLAKLWNLYDPKNENIHLVAFATAIIFAVHPLHTEAVANIKGRDEIMAMLGAIASTWFLVKYMLDRRLLFIILACLSFFIGLLSKENTITYLAVIPAAIYVFTRSSLSKSIQLTLPLVIPTILFLVIRNAVLGFDFGDEPKELMNNPFLKLVDGNYISFTPSERFATIIFTLGKYISLLLWPHPLTNDYYPRHIDIMTISNPKVLVSLLAYLGLIVWSIIGLAKRKITGFAAFYFLATLSIVSNIVFPIGTNMSERFMFMPSLGYALALAFVIYKFLGIKWGMKPYLIVIGLLALPMLGKTITRNMAWADDFTLYTTDVEVSGNSAKALNAAGGVLVTKSIDEKDPAKKRAMIEKAITYLDKAIHIHPYYKNAYLIKGNGSYYLGDYENAISAYEKALAIDPEWVDASKNLAVSLRDAARVAGEQKGDLPKALTYLQRSIQLYPNDIETLRLLGVANGISKRHDEALKYFLKVVELEPNGAGGYVNLFNAYMALNQMDKATGAKQKALALDPKAFNAAK